MHLPLAALVAHAVITLRAWNPLYCTTALLSAPLARQRQAALARVLDALCVPLQAVQPIVGQLPTSFRGEGLGEGGSIDNAPLHLPALAAAAGRPCSCPRQPDVATFLCGPA